jgi:NAD(P)-dependent dehydrogenase (short-subunit alcohol dehydrogenase family)
VGREHRGVADGDSVEAAVLTVAEATGGALDVLINNAGIAGRIAPAGDVTAADVQEVYNVNVLGAVRTIHAFLPLRSVRSPPVVVNVSSGLGSLAL